MQRRNEGIKESGVREGESLRPRGRERRERSEEAERKGDREHEKVRNKCRDRDKAGVTERYRNREAEETDRGDSKQVISENICN